ncbi:MULTISPECIES: NosR/NirI family protein [Thalassospira]|uniref:FMN-binding protein n=2 Tax=Thalassospira TaxID=168934 RepID=A0A367WAX4_9PROT|nr:MULTISPECIES: NosR/NirI family protein [Thalassospira]MDG4720419.1 4Fe-4S binding protein [Thalassospira sp. FZY0004]RCK37600.1 FMN-binding protein [Thalassospira profundimaris]
MKTPSVQLHHHVTKHASRSRLFLAGLWVLAIAFLLPVLTGFAAAQAQNNPVIAQLISKVPAASLVAGADAYGPIDEDIPVAPVLSNGEQIGWAFITSDFVGTTGYSGKPIHVMIAVDKDAKIIGVKLVKHSEPIVLIGIPEARIAALTEGYIGFDLVEAAKGSDHELNIISGATVTIMVIDDSILRSGIKVARALGLGGLSAPTQSTAPQFEIDPDAVAPADWFTMVGDGTLRRMSLDVGQVNEAFAAMDDPRALERPITAAPDATFIDMYATLVSIPAIGKATLGERGYNNLRNWLKEGEQAILVAARGEYSFKGSGYVRGGLFDRIQLIQGDMSVRFRDRNHRRVGDIMAEGAPELTEMDLFKIPAASNFDPTQPWRIELLVHRDIGAIERLYTTFDIGWQPPANYLKKVAPIASVANPSEDTEIANDEQAAKAALWQRIWRDKTVEIVVLSIMLVTLTAAFFFQGLLTRSAKVTFWFRICFLTVTLVFLGWYANAQLSVVNLMALTNSLVTGFTWEAFLLDPLTFILWFSVAAALIFWGRGAYCGWLCPFGALQELTNRIAKFFHVPQWTLPWGLHERLWAVKYIVFLGLFGTMLASIDQAEKLAEVEPFKTAIILKFDRSWPFVLYALVLLGAGLFVERFYCRYLCPLGAALAIPARIRMFDWLKRYKECGTPCQNCAHECMVQAIHPTGEINPNECHNCLHCQVLYQSEKICPVVIKKLKRQESLLASMEGAKKALNRTQTTKPNPKENS